MTTSELGMPPLGDIPNPIHPVVFTLTAMERFCVLLSKFQYSSYEGLTICLKLVNSADKITSCPRTIANLASSRRPTIGLQVMTICL